MVVDGGADGRLTGPAAARRLDIDRSELLRTALRRHLAALAADHDVQAYTEQPVTAEENAFAGGCRLGAGGGVGGLDR